MVNKFVNILWNNNPINLLPLVDNSICQSIATETESDSRIRQCAAKQASSIVRGESSKRSKQLYKLAELRRENKNTKYLQRKIEKRPLNKPKINNLNVELDSRFVDFQEVDGEFNLFVRIKQIGDKEEIKIPVKYNKVINKWRKLGQLKPAVRLSKTGLTLYFDVEEKEKTGTVKVGADQGCITCLSLSDGQVTPKNKHGHDLSSIIKIITRKTKGSKAFHRAKSHRKNYINWSLNQLNFTNVKEVGFEKLMNVRKGKRSSRFLSHWTYTLIKDKLVRLSEDKGFIFTEQDNKFMSQRCSSCGWTHKSNRKGKTFKCKHCGFLTDSDLNAASNHEIELPDVKAMWQGHVNRSTGFTWLTSGITVGQEPIVPDVQKTLLE